ncbi:MAG: hypothetical protein LKG26_05000 [Saccharofermentans sp.]|jgi:hypothetical protein|nr:hypothetical protein [Mageeibacillus sp.]MCI1263484.1 hypothetical protein [Saccharofermentans sp.]MCI1275423.1 hypothetical protein [Saccharofermentans sp.]MCI2044178.1 hypothetical protein [Mageeibacillus sp.]
MDTREIKKEGANRYILLGGLLLFVALFNLAVSYKFYPITDGWFQDAASYMHDGKVIYRDFHMYIPPAYPVLMAILYNFFGKTLILYRMYGICERLFLVFLTWCALRRVFRPEQTFMALMISSVVYVLNLQDVFYGYYQMSIVAAMLMLLAAIRVYEAVISGSEARTIIIRSGLFGLSICYATLVKHTVGIILGFAMTVVLILIILRDYRKSIVRVILAEFVAFAVPLGAFAAYMSAIGALRPMLTYLFGGDSSKGSYSSVLFGFLPRITSETSILLAVLILVTVFLSLNHKFLKKTGYAAEIIVFGIITYLTIEWWRLYFTKAQIAAFPWYFKCLCLAVILAQAAESYIICNKVENDFLRIIPFVVHGGGMFLIFFFMTRCPLTFGNWEVFRASRQYLLYAVFFVEVAFSLYLLIRHMLKKEECGKELLICVMAWGILYIHGMSNTIEEHGMLLPMGFLFALVFSAEGRRRVATNSVVAMLGFLLVFSGSYQKCAEPYHWWVSGSLASARESTEPFEDPNLKGFRGEPEYVSAINSMYELVKANYIKGDAVYSFPSINYFNLIEDAPNTMFGKVDFFDTCPDSVAEQDAQTLRNDMPEIVVFDCPVNEVWTVHEKLFRDGNPCGQRKIVATMCDLVQGGDYVLAGSFEPTSYVDERIYIFVRNDGRDVVYGQECGKTYVGAFYTYCDNLTRLVTN